MAARQFAKEFPWVKWFFDDWLNDEGLQICSYAAQGLWMSLLALMRRGEPYGVLADKRGPWTLERLAGRLQHPVEEISALITELETHHVFSRDGEGRIYSRRLVRDYQKAQQCSKAGTEGAKRRYCSKATAPYGESHNENANDRYNENGNGNPNEVAIAPSRARASEHLASEYLNSGSDSGSGSAPPQDSETEMTVQPPDTASRVLPFRRPPQTETIPTEMPMVVNGTLAVARDNPPNVVPTVSPPFEHTYGDAKCELWAEAHYTLHPKKKNKFAALRILSAMYSDPVKRDAMDRNHKLWCKTHEWRKEHGRFCPVLDEWLENDGYLSPPDGVNDCDEDFPYPQKVVPKR